MATDPAAIVQLLQASLDAQQHRQGEYLIVSHIARLTRSSGGRTQTRGAETRILNRATSDHSFRFVSVHHTPSECHILQEPSQEQLDRRI